MSNEPNVSAPQEALSEILQIRRDKLSELQARGADPFRQVRYDRRDYSSDIREHYEDYEDKTVSVAGRIMSKRVKGKASFCDLQDSTGRIQLFVKIDEMGEEEFGRFKKNK